MRTALCNRKILARFIQNQLDEDDRLDFLIHLDSCPNCWEAVYSASKASHPHYYKRPINTRRFADIDLSALEKPETADRDEGVFEVA
jgi:hypothetical protein